MEEKEIKEVVEVKEVKEETPEVKVNVPVAEASTPAVATVATVDTTKMDAAIVVDELKLTIKKLKRELKVNPGNQDAATQLAALESQLKEINGKKWKKGLAIGGVIVSTVGGAFVIGASLVKKSGDDSSVADATFEEVKEKPE